MNRHFKYIFFARILILGSLIVGWAGAGSPQAMADDLTLTADTPWVVAAGQPEAVERALEDVKRDWYKVLGHTPIVLNAPPENWSGPVIYLGLGGEWMEEMVDEPFQGAESFLLQLRRDGSGRQALLATGADMRGAIYAAYAFSEEILGVEPLDFWTDREPERRQSIRVPADLDRRFGPPTFRYRGLFINDEDLLSVFAPDPLRENVFSLAMADRICETILRLRGNMIVPGTFLFPDERYMELASRRGLVLSFHHIQVMGLNTFRWPDDVPFSFDQHPEIMERYWQACIDALKGKEVVWTVGYRGKHDRPFWTAEEGMDTPEERGAAISRAVKRQVEMLREQRPGDMIIKNLWMEGADMWHDGLIEVPPEVTTVWPNAGNRIIRDHGRVRAGQGVYYHTALVAPTGNQLSEMADPARIYSELGRFVRAGATEYFLLNVSDIRPVPLSTESALRFVWNAAPYMERAPRESMEAFILDWCRRQFGEDAAEAAARVYIRYFDIPYQQEFGDMFFRQVRRLNPRVSGRIGRGSALTDDAIEQAAEFKSFAAKYRSDVAAVVAEAEALERLIPAARRDFYRAHLLTQARLHLGFIEIMDVYGQALMAYVEGDNARGAEYIERALQEMDGVFETLREGEYGKWAGWYQGEYFVGLENTRDRLRFLLANLRGEEPPPIRAGRSYSDINRYQEPFLENFPLLYPAGGRIQAESSN